MHTQFLQAYEHIEEHARETLADHEHLPYWLITLSYGRHLSQALLAWSEETLARLSELEHDGEIAQANTLSHGLLGSEERRS